MPEITANGLRFFVEDQGTGEPVVMLHGFPDTSRVWRYQAPALVDAGFRVILPDMRGRGRSEMPEGVEAYHLSNMVADVVGIMEALGVQRAHIVGHDWGAAVAWLFASLQPARVNRLVTLSVGHPSTRSEPTLEFFQKGWYRLLFQFPGIESTLQADDWRIIRILLSGAKDLEQYIANLSTPGALTPALNWYRASMPPERLMSAPPQLPPVQAPTLGVFGADDPFLTEDAMRRSSEHVAGPWRYERVDEAGHWIQLDAPERVTSLLLEFLGER